MQTRWVIQALTERDAREIAGWRYLPPYDFYDADRDPGELAELLDPARWPGKYYAALSPADELVGYFVFRHVEETVDVGLGLRPDLTGQGSGLDFVRAGLDFARKKFSPTSFSLAVATFNQRAIRVYERAGFRRLDVFAQHTNGGVHECLRMAREATSSDVE